MMTSETLGCGRTTKRTRTGLLGTFAFVSTISMRASAMRPDSNSASSEARPCATLYSVSGRDRDEFEQTPFYALEALRHAFEHDLDRLYAPTLIRRNG
jgi:hypothetical protein